MKNRIFSYLKSKLNSSKTTFQNKYSNYKNNRTFNNQYFRTNKNKTSMNSAFIIPLIFCPFSLSKSIAYMEKEKEKEKEKNQKEKEESHDIHLKDLIRGEYENKIRMFCGLEKKFLVFAGIKSSENLQMTYGQFLDCIIPFQHMKTIPQDVLEEKLKKNKFYYDIFHQIDVNNDRLISFEEFVIWNLIITLDINELKNIYPKGDITKEQLGEYLMQKLNSYNAMKVTEKAFADARLIKTDYDTIFKVLVDFLSKYFKQNTINIDKEVAKLRIDMNLVGLIYEVIFFSFLL